MRRWLSIFATGPRMLPCMVDDAMRAEALRVAAFSHVRQLLAVRDQLSAGDLTDGFTFEGVRYPLVNPQRGIFKPRQMRNLLSIRTVFPKRGGKVWYDDQRDVHRQIYDGEDAVDYAFMGTNPDAAENRWLREAMEQQVPIIYFLGVSPGRYQAIIPTFIVDWDARAARVRVVFGVETMAAAPVLAIHSRERRYALQMVQRRLHQATFRDAVITAYRGRCALSGLPEPLLLDAAHIIPDRDERLGQPVVSNGIPLSKIHHAAFDAHLLGIDPDFQVHVSRRLLSQHDGPILEALKNLQGRLLYLPQRAQDRPDRDRLAARFAQFRSAA